MGSFFQGSFRHYRNAPPRALLLHTLGMGNDLEFAACSVPVIFQNVTQLFDPRRAFAAPSRQEIIMRALCWHGKGDVRVDTVPDPKLQHPRDAIIKITACAICGSDLHLLDGYQPTMESGDILGHENMGEVIELGAEVTNLRIGDRVVVPFTISCGQCWFCERGLFSCCDRTNPNAALAAKAMGQSPAGLFGFSHMLGGYSGGQAEYLRVPMADVGPIKNSRQRY